MLASRLSASLICSRITEARRARLFCVVADEGIEISITQLVKIILILSIMSLNTYFRLASYATVASAALALFVAGGGGVGLAAVFAVVLIAAWNLKGTRWQLSERIALVVILVSLPIFYLDWRILTPYLQIEFLETGQRANAEVAVLAHLILFLSA